MLYMITKPAIKNIIATLEDNIKIFNRKIEI